MNSHQLAAIYLDLKEFVIRAGYSHEIDWQADVTLDNTTETDFLRESAWVVLSAGFRESVVRKVFPAVSDAFLHWHDAKQICTRLERCTRDGLAVFGHRGKIDAICQIITVVAISGFEDVKLRVQKRGVGFLKELPYVGPVTAYHLAKNLGLAVAKPDRHLVRIAQAFGCRSPAELCAIVSKEVGDPASVVDLVFWRYATLKRDYEVELSRVCDHSR